MPAFYTKISSLIHWLASDAPLIGFCLLGVCGLILLSIGALRVFDIRRLYKQKTVLLEVTPQIKSNKAPIATEQLFAVLHGLETTRPLIAKLLRQRITLSLEIVSTRAEGIRYHIRLAEKDASVFEHDIVAYAPDMKIRRIDDFQMSGMQGRAKRLLEFKQTGHYAYPLQTQHSLEHHDPGAYITGAMTKLKPHELVILQVVIVPARVRTARALSARIAHNEALLYSLGKRPLAQLVFGGINGVLFSIMNGISEVTNGTSHSGVSLQQHDMQRKREAAMKIRPARTLSPFEQQLAESVHDKLTQPLFHVNIRALVVSDSKRESAQRSKLLCNSLAVLGVPEYQSLKSRFVVSNRYRQLAFDKRLPSIFPGNSCLLASSEIANLYHFPHSLTNQTENVVKSLARSLPAPLSLKGDSHFDIVLGRNHHQGAYTDIGLMASERERHMYVIGGTGNGKTTLLAQMIIQDIANGKSVAVVDPHGDLAKHILTYIPENRLNDVIYFNPDDIDYPIGLNLLEVPAGLTGKELQREQSFVEDAVISIFRKIFSDDDSGGHRVEYILRNCIQTAFTIEGATIFTIHKLLTSKAYRTKIAGTLEDEFLRNFWLGEFGNAGSFQQVKMIAGVTAKIGRFYASIQSRQILEQPKSTIDFDEILNGKILICNLAKGHIGEDTSTLFGTAILAKLQLAAYRRIRTDEQARLPFYLYVDEFQNFATPLFVQILSEARKYRLFITMAEQSTSQQERKVVENILDNAGIITCFRTANPADEQLMLHVFNGFVEPGEIANLPAYNFYMKISALQAQLPFSGETVKLENTGSSAVAAMAVAASRANYAMPVPLQPMKKSRDNARSTPRRRAPLYASGHLLNSTRKYSR